MDQADDLSVGHGRPAAVARVQGGVDLDPQPADQAVDRGAFDPRDDALGDGDLLAADRISVDAHRLLDGRDVVGQRQRRAAVEKGRLVDLDDRQVEARRDGDHLGRHAVGGLVGLDEDLAGVEHHVGVGENPIALDDRPRAAAFLGVRLVPRPDEIRLAAGDVDLHDRVGDLVFGLGQGGEGQKQSDNE